MPSVDPYVDQVFDAVGSMVRGEIDLDEYRTRVRQALVDAADHGAAQREQLVEGLLASDHNIEVQGCASCPFVDGSCCVHPSATTEHTKPFILRKRGEQVPSFCPLRDAATRVVLGEP